jgi:dTDP-4-dehydrorhamnose 3,5-epimerase
METFNARYAAEAGLPTAFAQDNQSFSSRGVLRGLHYQYPTWQGKLVRVVSGEVFDVAVDIRRESPGFGRWFGVNLSSENRKQMYIPEGFAHGFCVLSDTAEVIYKCTTSYVPAEDRCILWNDPDIGVQWPIAQPRVSEKDACGQRLIEVDLSAP